VSCSEKLLRSAGELALATAHICRRISPRNLEEIEKVKHQFAWAQDYTDVYDQCGLLTPRTVLGHCIHLSPRERETLAARGANVAHCPTANLFPAQRHSAPRHDARGGLHIGLGATSRPAPN
jgi:guanine deaminase